MNNTLKTFDDPMRVRQLAKLAAAFSMTVLFALITFGNLTDYGANFTFVRHVLTMDTIPADAGIRYRAIVSPSLHHAGYALIIATELVVTVLCGWGVVRMRRAFGRDARDFARAKAPALAGVTLAYLLTQVGIFAIGNEWFGMWMSREWNGVESVFRLVAMTLGALIFLSLD